MIDVEADVVFDDPARPRYRYWLRRRLAAEGRPLAFIGWNPTVADGPGLRPARHSAAG